MAGEEGDGSKKSTGEVLGHRRFSSFSKMSTLQLTVAGVLIAGAVGYYVLYYKPNGESAAGKKKDDRVARQQ